LKQARVYTGHMCEIFGRFENIDRSAGRCDFTWRREFELSWGCYGGGRESSGGSKKRDLTQNKTQMVRRD